MCRVKSLIGLNISVFLMMAGVGMIAVLLPKRLLELAVSQSSAGYLASTFAFTYILVQIPLGRLSDRFTCKPFIIAGYILMGLAGLMYYYTQSAGPVWIGRMVQGMGEAPIWALAPALLSLHYPMEKGRIIGLYNAALHLGLTVGPMLGMLVLRWKPGIFQFLLFAVMCFFGAFLVWILVEEIDRAKPARNDPRYGNLLKYLRFKPIMAALPGVVLYGGGYGLFVSTVPAFLIGAKGFSQETTGLYFTLLFLCLGVSQLITGPLCDKWGHRIFMVLGLAVSGFCLLPFPGLSFPWIYLSLISAGLGLGAFAVASLAFINESAKDSNKGEMSSMYYLAWALGYFGLPLVGAQVGNRWGLPLFFHGYAVLLLITVMLPVKYGCKKGKKALLH